MGLDDVKVHAGLLGATIVAHLAIGLLMFMDHEERHHWHDYQGPQGTVLCLVRLGLFVLLLLGVQATWQTTQAGSIAVFNQEGHRRFLQLIAFLGSLYFLAVPVAVAMANHAIPPVAQQEFISLAIYASQLTTIAFFLYQFIKPDSLYCQLSYKKRKTGGQIIDFSKLD